MVHLTTNMKEWCYRLKNVTLNFNVKNYFMRKKLFVIYHYIQTKQQSRVKEFFEFLLIAPKTLPDITLENMSVIPPTIDFAVEIPILLPIPWLCSWNPAKNASSALLNVKPNVFPNWLPNDCIALFDVEEEL